jgi:hypothetical protein
MLVMGRGRQIVTSVKPASTKVWDNWDNTGGARPCRLARRRRRRRFFFAIYRRGVPIVPAGRHVRARAHVAPGGAPWTCDGGPVRSPVPLRKTEIASVSATDAAGSASGRSADCRKECACGCADLEWSAMPAGDASRTWFPEMLETLRAHWRADLTFRELIALRDELDAMLHRIRLGRHTRPPVVTCWRCGHVGPAAERDVSVRAMILSLARFNIAPAA